ncbi:TIR domain-containing protein [Xanthobacter sp.]|uniref:TIR domain-containing protein n=1 Tax=Xanthobacter sp. TaxID=35809 RepID=UPI0025F07A96|nr:TIR domain-containing protein [Xanthobacter sp.]
MRRVFYSFHFQADFWRTHQVRNIGALEGQPLCHANEWEEIKRKGDAAIEKWIHDSMYGRSCVVVLVGAQTSSRPWVTYEIKKGWTDGKGVLAVRIDKLLGTDSLPSIPGPNPLSNLTFQNKTVSLSDVAPLKTPAGADSKAAYASIAGNIDTWIEEAISIRKNWK